MQNYKKTLSNSPIIEAVCEIRFSGNGDFGEQNVASFYSKMSSRFPLRRKIAVQQIKVEFDEKKDPSPKSDYIITERDQFASEDGNQFLQFDNNLVAVHCLKPYSSWEDFSSQVISAFDSFSSFLDNKSIERIGVRYVNAIEIKEVDADMSDYFNIYPQVITGVISKKNLFNLDILDESVQEVKTRIRMQRQMNQEGYSRVFFDIDSFSENVGILENEDFTTKVNALHESVEKIFFLGISKKTTKLLV